MSTRRLSLSDGRELVLYSFDDGAGGRDGGGADDGDGVDHRESPGSPAGGAHP